MYGGNDEGIRSAGGRLEGLCGAVETVAARGHGRVLIGAPPGEHHGTACGAGGLAHGATRWRWRAANGRG